MSPAIVLVYALAALAEIAGCFAFWAWLRNGQSPWWLIPGVGSLMLFAWRHLHRGVASVALAGRKDPARPLGHGRGGCLRDRRGDHPVRATAGLRPVRGTRPQLFPLP